MNENRIYVHKMSWQSIQSLCFHLDQSCWPTNCHSRSDAGDDMITLALEVGLGPDSISRYACRSLWPVACVPLFSTRRLALCPFYVSCEIEQPFVGGIKSNLLYLQYEMQPYEVVLVAWASLLQFWQTATGKKNKKHSKFTCTHTPCLLISDWNADRKNNTCPFFPR